MSSQNLFYNDSVSDSSAQNDSSYTRNRHELDAHFASADSVPQHGDLYEQIDQLEAIDMEELVKLLADTEDGNELNKDPVSLADFFEGLAQLATTGVVEMTEIVESIHREVILRPLGRFNDKHLNKWQRGLTGRIYGTIRHIMLMVGNNLASVLRIYKNFIVQKTAQPLPDSLKKLVNVINGVMGDHLVNNQNALAIPMMLYTKEGNPQSEALSGRIVILCHGLCMSHLSWRSQEGNNLGEAIHISQPDTTVLYLDYNTGRRISRSGRKFSQLLPSTSLSQKRCGQTMISVVA